MQPRGDYLCVRGNDAARKLFSKLDEPGACSCGGGPAVARADGQ